MKYRKKPVEVEAVEWTGENLYEMAEFMGTDRLKCSLNFYLSKADGGKSIKYELIVGAGDGGVSALYGDYVVKDANGEFHTCKPDVFLKTYEPVE